MDEPNGTPKVSLVQHFEKRIEDSQQHSKDLLLGMREFLLSQILDLKDRVDDGISSGKQNIAIAKETLDLRLSEMNNFRKTIEDQARTFASVEALLALTHRVSNLEKQIADCIPSNQYRDDAHRVEGRLKDIDDWKSQQVGMASQKSVDSARWLALAGLGLGIIATLLNILE